MSSKINDISKQVFYELLLKQTKALFENEHDPIANMANLSALLFSSLSDINWAGFYRIADDQLVLGPFQGNPACVRIAVGSGVCGSSVEKQQTLLVADVHKFEGHITCDAASNSEIVIPIIKNGRVFGVLDIDSPAFNRFDDQDKQGLEKIVSEFINLTDF